MDLRAVARGHTHMALNVLAGVARRGASEPARVAAAIHLLDRGWGKAPQTYSEGELDVRVTIRHILEHIDERPVVVDGNEVRCIETDTTTASDAQTLPNGCKEE